MTLQETGDIMEVLSVAYPRFYANKDENYKAKALVLWAEMLKGYPAQLVGYAVKAYIAGDTKGFPPSIGQIMEKIKQLTETPQMSAEEAWDLVAKAIRNSAYNSAKEFEKLPENVRRVVHSPGQLREWAIDPDFNAGVESSNFKRAYRTKCEREKMVATLPKESKNYIRMNEKFIEKISGELK